MDFDVSGSFEEEAPAYSPAGSTADARPSGDRRAAPAPSSQTAADESIAEEPEEEGDVSSEYRYFHTIDGFSYLFSYSS
jgi:hypothetical protein